MGWGEAIQGGVALLGAFGNHKAANAQEDAAQAGLDWTKNVYRDAQGNFAPYLGYGQGMGGLGGLQQLMGGDTRGFLEHSPDFRAAQDAQIYGMDHSAANAGRLGPGGFGGGGYLADLSKAQGDLAVGYLNNYRNALFRGADMGQQAASALGSIGNGLAGNVQNGYNQIGQAQGSQWDSLGQLGAGLGGIANHYLQGQQVQPLTNSSYGGVPAQGSGPEWNTGLPSSNGWRWGP